MSATSRGAGRSSAEVPSIEVMEGEGKTSICRKKGLKMMFASSIVSTVLLLVFAGLFFQVSRNVYRLKDFKEIDDEFPAFKLPAVTVCQVRPFATTAAYDAQRLKPFDLYDGRIAWSNQSSQTFGPVDARWHLPGDAVEWRVRFDAGNNTRLPANESSRSILASSDGRSGYDFEFELCNTAKFDTESMAAAARLAAARATNTPAVSVPEMPDRVRNFTIQLTALPRPTTRAAFSPRTIVFVHDPDEKPSMLFHSRLGRKIPHAFLRSQDTHSVQVEVVAGRMVKMSVGKCLQKGSQFEEQRRLLAMQMGRMLGCTPRWSRFVDEENAEFPLCPENPEEVKVTRVGFNQILHGMANDMQPFFRAGEAQPTKSPALDGTDDLKKNCLDGFRYQHCKLEDEVPPRCSFWVYHVAFMFDGRMMGSFQQG